MTDKERQTALQNATPKRPRENELGGGIYYTCHWIACNETLKRWWDYCPRCGQRIEWRDE